MKRHCMRIFPKLVKDTKLQIQEAQRIRSRINTKHTHTYTHTCTHTHLYIRYSNCEDQRQRKSWRQPEGWEAYK